MEAIGAAGYPSPAIWKDCRNSLLNDLALGKYAAYNGNAANTGSVVAGTIRPAVGDFEVICDSTSDFVNNLPADQEGGRLDVTTGATSDNDSVIIHTGVGIGLVAGSGNKVWYEVSLSPGAAADQGFFMGLIEEDGLADPLQDAAILVADQSYFGFKVGSDDTGAVDAEYQLNQASPTTVVADVTNAAAFTAAGGTAQDWPVADVFKKFGLHFNGQDKLSYFVDGRKIATLTIADGTTPTQEMAPVLAFKVGTNAARSFNLKFMRYAYQLRA
jgi:hypothetical protein